MWKVLLDINHNLSLCRSLGGSGGKRSCGTRCTSRTVYGGGPFGGGGVSTCEKGYDANCGRNGGNGRSGTTPSKEKMKLDTLLFH